MGNSCVPASGRSKQGGSQKPRDGSGPSKQGESHKPRANLGPYLGFSAPRGPSKQGGSQKPLANLGPDLGFSSPRGHSKQGQSHESKTAQTPFPWTIDDIVDKGNGWTYSSVQISGHASVTIQSTTVWTANPKEAQVKLKPTKTKL